MLLTTRIRRDLPSLSAPSTMSSKEKAPRPCGSGLELVFADRRPTDDGSAFTELRRWRAWAAPGLGGTFSPDNIIDYGWQYRRNEIWRRTFSACTRRWLRCCALSTHFARNLFPFPIIFQQQSLCKSGTICFVTQRFNKYSLVFWQLIPKSFYLYRRG